LGRTVDPFGDAPSADTEARRAGAAVGLLSAESKKIEGLCSVSQERVRGVAEAHVPNSHVGAARETFVGSWHWTGDRRLHPAVRREPSCVRGGRVYAPDLRTTWDHRRQGGL